jgi:hypothetical protein
MRGVGGVGAETGAAPAGDADARFPRGACEERAGEVEVPGAILAARAEEAPTWLRVVRMVEAVRVRAGVEVLRRFAARSWAVPTETTETVAPRVRGPAATDKERALDDVAATSAALTSPPAARRRLPSTGAARVGAAMGAAERVTRRMGKSRDGRGGARKGVGELVRMSRSEFGVCVSESGSDSSACPGDERQSAGIGPDVSADGERPTRVRSADTGNTDEGAGEERIYADGDEERIYADVGKERIYADVGEELVYALAEDSFDALPAARRPGE